MTFMKEKVQCIAWFYDIRLPMPVHAKFRYCCEHNPAVIKVIKQWYEKFKETGNVGNLSRSDRPKVNDWDFPNSKG